MSTVYRTAPNFAATVLGAVGVALADRPAVRSAIEDGITEPGFGSRTEADRDLGYRARR